MTEKKKKTRRGGRRSGTITAPPPPPPPPERTNEFAGLTPDARHELAVLRIREKWGALAISVLSIGATLVDACHDGDEAEALSDAADDQPLFGRICTTLGTLQGGPTRKTLALARRVAAAAKVVNSNFWTVVPYTHRTKLVELPTPALMAEGAERAVKFGWTVEQTAKWVRGEKVAAGKEAAKARARSLAPTHRATAALAAAGTAASVERIGAQYGRLAPEKRREVKDSLARAEAAIARLRKRLGEIDRER